VFDTVPLEGLLYFLLKIGFSRKTFGRAPPQEPKPEPGRNPAN
jgi:hypothetical protein